MNDANNATPKRFMFVCEFCADNNPEMCGFFDADDLRVAPNGKWLCASCFDEDDSCLNHYYCWNDMPSPTFESLSTPNAPVEREAIARALMEQFHNPDESWFVPEDEYEASKFLVKCADAILAVRLDEATIRKDEREKCAKILDARVEVCKRALQNPKMTESQLDCWAELSNENLDNARSIRNGGKQP